MLFRSVGYPLQYSWASFVVHLEKNPPAMWETWAGSLGWEDPLKKGMATHSSILGIPWTEGPGELQSMGLQIVRQTERLTLSPGNVGVELKGLKD